MQVVTHRRSIGVVRSMGSMLSKENLPGIIACNEAEHILKENYYALAIRNDCCSNFLHDLSLSF